MQLNLNVKGVNLGGVMNAGAANRKERNDREKGAGRNLDYSKANRGDYKGEDWEPDDLLADGPLDEDKRRCTDCCFIPVFIVFAIFGLFISCWSIGN